MFGVAMEARLLTVNEAADYLRVSASYLYKLAEGRHLDYYRVGRRLLFAPADLDAWLESQRVVAV